MRVKCIVGNVLTADADLLISSANPWLNMSGGVNGAIFSECPDIQKELHNYLRSIGKTAIPVGSVVQTSSGTLPFEYILHAVAIDPFYDSSIELVTATLTKAFDLADSLNVKSISLPTLATGYGPLSIKEFGIAFLEVPNRNSFDCKIVLPKEESAKILRQLFC